MEGELGQLVQLILSLSSPATPASDLAAIQHRLQEIQASDAAWGVVPALLASDNPNIRFFGASTLQLKLARSWASLPPDHHLELKESLLRWLAHSAAVSYPSQAGQPARPGERVVLRKLAGAVTTLSLRVEGWDDWLLEVIMRVAAGDGTPQGGSGRAGVLEVLSVVIDQVVRADLVGQKRATYMGHLASSTSHLVDTLASALSESASFSEINSALNCFCAFLDAGQFAHPELTTLYPLLLPHLSRAETAVAACTAVQELLERSSGLSGGAGVTRFIGRIKVNELVSGWVASEWVRGVMSRATEDAEADDEALAVMKLICTIAEHCISFLFIPQPSGTHVPALTLGSPAIVELFRHVLAITCFPSSTAEGYNINEFTSGVWMALQEECFEVGLVSGPGDANEGRGGKEQEWEVVRTVFEALTNGLRQRSTWPSEEIISTLPKDERDAFRVYRTTAVSEVLLYAYYILRDSMLGALVETAAQQLANPSGKLENLEATLFCIYAVQEAVLPDESTHLPRLFSASILGSLPTSDYTALRGTTLRVVGAYAPWFSSHSEACVAAVSFVVPGLQDPTISPAAAWALRLLCDHNRKTLAAHASSFVAVLGGLEGKVDDSELVKVLESVSSVVQALPDSQIVEPLLIIADPIVAKLQSAVDAYAQLPAEARDLCLQQLGHLTATAKGLSDPEDDLVDLDASFDDSSRQRESAMQVLRDERIVAFRRRLATAIEGTVRLWAADVEVVQGLADFIKHTTSDAVPSALALEPLSLLSLATGALQVSVTSVWLSIVGSLLARLARDQNDSSLSDEDLARVGQPIEVALTIILSAYSNLAAMDENPDVVQAFLTYCAAIVRHFPRVLAILPTHLDAIITFAETGLGMQERFSLKATIELLIASVQQTRMASPSAAIFRQVLISHSRRILHALLLSIGGAVPRSHLAALSELLHACILRMPDETRAGLRELLAQPGWPTDKATDEAKIKFQKAVLAARTGKLVRGAVSDFALVSRGLDGSAYGAASLAVFD